MTSLDDRLRLQVEGLLQLVESDLVSFVATRTALMAITCGSEKGGMGTSRCAVSN